MATQVDEQRHTRTVDTTAPGDAAAAARASRPASSEASGTVLGVLIVGAGFSGVGMAIRLRQQGRRDFMICDKAASIGGTWWVNRYPGCACDVPSHLYSFSFEPNADWSRRFSTQPDIRDYLIACANKHDLQRHLRLNTDIVSLRWVEAHALWEAMTADGSVLRARVVVAGMGALSRPNDRPDIPGLERFAGRVFHSQQWDEDDDLAGKRVGVIGTGASAVQFVPRIQPQVAHLSVFQRSAPWILPKPDRRYATFEKTLLRFFPGWRLLQRLAIYLLAETQVPGLVFDPRWMGLHRRIARFWLRRHIHDPELRRRLTPDYAIGCKRILFSNDYYPALAAGNVELITDAIAEIDRDGVRTADGRHHRFDTLILGTGFTAGTPFPHGLFSGTDGHDLMDVWRDGPHAYKGTTVHGFPNLFLLLGPNTGLGHSSVIYMIESQIAYVLDALRTMQTRGLHRIEVRADAEQHYNHALERRLHTSAWQTGGCRSWYRHPLSGRNIAIWPGFTWAFRRQTQRFDADAYHLASEA